MVLMPCHSLSISTPSPSKGKKKKRRSRSRKVEEDEDEDEQEEGPSESSLDFAFPPQLSEALKRLYHLRRGNLISPGPMQSMDDRAETRGRHIRYPMEDCVTMMAPQLWSTGSLEGVEDLSGVKLQSFPAETLVLWDSVSRLLHLSKFLRCECAQLTALDSFYFTVDHCGGHARQPLHLVW